MLTLLLLLAQSPTIITDKNIKQVQSCHCKPTEAQLAGIRARQYVYVEPVPLFGPDVVVSGGYYGENLIRVRPMVLAYPYDLGRNVYATQPYSHVDFQLRSRVYEEIRANRRPGTYRR